MGTLRLLPFLFVPSLASAQVMRMDDGEPRVVASASRTARLAPDRVSFFVLIEGAAETAVDAGQRIERKVQAVTDAVKQQGGKAELMSSMPYGVMPAPNYGGYPGQALANPFVGRHILRVQMSRIDQLSSVAAALIAAGATSMTSPQYESTVTDSARRAKYAEAIAQARSDAEALAAGVGMRLGNLIEVTGNAVSTMPQFGGTQYINFGRPGEMSGPNMPPEVVINSNVTLRYRLTAR